jgi:hypothetical protein
MAEEASSAPSPGTFRRRLGWSLCAIAALLFGLLAWRTYEGLRWGRGGSRSDYERGQAIRLVKVFQLEVGNYCLEYGSFPWEQQRNVNATTAIDSGLALAKMRQSPRAERHYLQQLVENIKDGQLLDVWGNPIQVRVEPNSGAPVIWSCGPDGPARASKS